MKFNSIPSNVKNNYLFGDSYDTYAFYVTGLSGFLLILLHNSYDLFNFACLTNKHCHIIKTTIIKIHLYEESFTLACCGALLVLWSIGSQATAADTAPRLHVVSCR